MKPQKIGPRPKPPGFDPIFIKSEKRKQAAIFAGWMLVGGCFVAGKTRDDAAIILAEFWGRNYATAEGLTGRVAEEILGNWYNPPPTRGCEACYGTGMQEAVPGVLEPCDWCGHLPEREGKSK